MFIGSGGISEEAVRACHARSIECIVEDCPLMFCVLFDDDKYVDE